MSFPNYENGEPPFVSLKEYDVAPWAEKTCIDRKGMKFVIVDIQDPEKVIARLPETDYEVLNEIFQSAHADYAKQQA